MKWIILVSAVSLAVAAKPEGKGDDKRLVLAPLAVRCCKSELALPDVYKNKEEMDGCAGAVDKKKGEDNEAAHDEETCDLIDCILGGQGLLNDDKSVKEEGLRELLMGNAHADAKTVVKNALDKCFGEHNNSEDKGSCKSGMVKFFACSQQEILTNCPKSLWREGCEKHEKEAEKQ